MDYNIFDFVFDLFVCFFVCFVEVMGDFGLFIDYDWCVGEFGKIDVKDFVVKRDFGFVVWKFFGFYMICVFGFFYYLYKILF